MVLVSGLQIACKFSPSLSIEPASLEYFPNRTLCWFQIKSTTNCIWKIKRRWRQIDDSGGEDINLGGAPELEAGGRDEEEAVVGDPDVEDPIR